MYLVLYTTSDRMRSKLRVKKHSDSSRARVGGSANENERWPSSVSHSAGARGRETVEAVVHVTGLGWARPTWETHNVSFVLNDSAVGTGLPLSSCCLLSATKCGNDFCLWISARSFGEFSPLFLSVPICFPIFQSFTWQDSLIFVKSMGHLQLRGGVWREVEE